VLGQDQATQLDVLVANLKDKQGFKCEAPFAASEETTAHRAPGYAGLLAGLEKTPIDPALVGRTMRWIQCGLGSLTAVCYFCFALRAFRNLLAASLAGFLCALHPFWIINTGELADGVVVSFLLAGALLLGAKAIEDGGAFASLVYGLLLAGLAMMRAALLPFAIIGLVWFLFRCRTIRRGWLAALLAFLGLFNGLAYWTIRNWNRFDHAIVPVSDSAYLHLWKGNNPQSTGGPQSDEAALKAFEAAGGSAGELSQTIQTRRYERLAQQFWRQVALDPAGTLARRIRAAIYFVFGEDWFTRGMFWRTTDVKRFPDWLARWHATWFYAVMILICFFGLLGWRWSYAWRVEAMPSSLALVWVPLPYVLSHAELFSGPRLPLDGILLCFTALAMACFIPKVGYPLLQGAGTAGPQGPRPR
jgi:hypothetical protein